MKAIQTMETNTKEQSKQLEKARKKALREERKARRKEMKKTAHGIVRKHYFLLVGICLMASLFGTSTGNFYDAMRMEPLQQETIQIEAEEAVEKAEDNTVLQVISALLFGDTETAGAISSGYIENVTMNTTSKTFGRTRGIFSDIVNKVASGAIIVTVYEALSSMIVARNLFMILLILGSAFLILFLWLFIAKSYAVFYRRIVMEACTYEEIPRHRFLYLLKPRPWARIAWTMLVTTTLETLWDLTVVGGFIKHYSYAMVPYIMAENPEMKAREAITLSRRMMNGHKWELFTWQMTFIIWYALDAVTMGLAGIVYLDPYMETLLAEYYKERRAEAKAEAVPGAEKLQDTWLFEKADTETLRNAYSDFTAEIDREDQNPLIDPDQTPVSRKFGIVLAETEKEREYDREMEHRYSLNTVRDILKGRVYPGRLGSVHQDISLRKENVLTPTRRYSVVNVAVMFILFSCIGWVFEVSMHLVTDGEFVNRGMLQGPWLPIYGVGTVVVLCFLYRLRSDPLKEFLGTVLLCGAIEYFTSLFTEILYNGERWWDYTGYFLNLNGRICAEGLLAFGLGGLAIVYVAAPMVDDFLRQWKQKAVRTLALTLMILFAVDVWYSSGHPNMGEGVTSYTSEADFPEKAAKL